MSHGTHHRPDQLPLHHSDELAGHADARRHRGRRHARPKRRARSAVVAVRTDALRRLGEELVAASISERFPEVEAGDLRLCLRERPLSPFLSVYRL